MKVDWLNRERSKATVTRGIWRWRRMAEVALMPDPKSYAPDEKAWKYVASGRKVEYDVAAVLEAESTAAAHREQHDLDWRPVTLPEARTVRR